MRFIEIPALITEDIEDPNIVDITETETVTASISGTTLTINGDSKVSGETTITLTGDVTVDAIIKENLRQPSIHKIIIKTNGAGNFTYVPNNTVTASSVSTTTKTGSDLEILLITTSGGDTYLDLDVADYVSPAANFSNVVTGFKVSELTSTYGATAKLYKPDGTLLTTVNSETMGSGVNFGYTESPGDVIYKLEVTDDLGRKSTYNLPRKWINYAMGTTSTPGFQKFRLEGIDYTTTMTLPSLGSSSTAKVYRTSDHGYMGIKFKIQGRNAPSDDWVDIANADENDDVLAFGDYLYHRVWVKPTAKATTTVSSSNVVTLTLSNLTEENVTTSFTGADPFEIDETSNVFVFEETAKIGTVPFTVTLGTETYTNAVTATTEEVSTVPNTDMTAAGPNKLHDIQLSQTGGYMSEASGNGKYIAYNKTNDSVVYILKGDPVSGYTDYTTITYSQVTNAYLVGSMTYDGKYIIIARRGSNSYHYEIWKHDESAETYTKLSQTVQTIDTSTYVHKPAFVPAEGNYNFAISGHNSSSGQDFSVQLYKHTVGTDTWTAQTIISNPRPSSVQGTTSNRSMQAKSFTKDGKYLMFGNTSTYGGYDVFNVDFDENTVTHAGNWVNNGDIGHSGSITSDGKYILLFDDDSNSRKIFKNNDAGDWSSSTDVTSDFTFEDTDNDQGYGICFFGENSEYFVSTGASGGAVRVYRWYPKKEVTLTFSNPTLTLTGQNVTISSAKLYRDDVLFHTYGTESNVVLRSDQTGTYQAIVNDVYYSNRVVPDFTTTRSVSAPQLEFDGYNKLTFFKETIIQNNVIVTDTRSSGAWGCHLNIDTNYTGEGYQWKLHMDDASHSLVPDHDFNDDSAHGIYRYLRYTGTEDSGSWTFYNVNADNSQGSQDTVLKIYSSNGSNEVTNAGIGSTLWVWSWNMSFSGHLTKTSFTPTSTTLGVPDGTTRDLTTQSSVYIYETGTYTANVQSSDTFAYLSNVATTQALPTRLQGSDISAMGTTNYTRYGVPSSQSIDVEDFLFNSSSNINPCIDFIHLTNSQDTFVFDLESVKTINKIRIYAGNTTPNWASRNTGSVVKLYNGSTLVYTSHSLTFSRSSPETYYGPYEEGKDYNTLLFTTGYTNIDKITVETPSTSAALGRVEVNDFTDAPSLTFDGFNKLSIENITQTSSTLEYGSNTYDTNTASNVYVTDAGEYILEASDANTFVTSNVYVGAVDTIPEFTAAFHHGAFSASDYSSAYSSVADAATAGFVYSDTPAGTYTWGTLAAQVKERENPDFTANSTLHTDYSSTYGWGDDNEWEVSAKDEFSTTYEVWKAFSKTYASNNNWLSGSAPSENSPQWIKIKYPSQQVIKSYVIRARENASPRWPTAWKLQGSNNDSEWTDIGTEQTQTEWVPNQNKSFDLSTNTTAYQYYRLRITGARESASSSNSDYVAIGHWFLFTETSGSTVHTKYTRYTYTPPASTITANVLRVAGGGGGSGTRGGGGGAGGLLYSENVSLSGTKSIVVGNGGIGYEGTQQSIENGYDTVFTGLTTSIGGGHGGGNDAIIPTPGGSGGGGSARIAAVGTGAAGTSGQGNAGGNGSSGDTFNGGGGGGAGAVGGDSGGVGGVGLDYSSVFGTTYGVSGFFAGGGGGGTSSGGNTGGNGGGGGGSYGHGTKHTGGGGAGIGNGSGTSGDGGSGIVLIKKLGPINPPTLNFDGYNKLTIDNVDTVETVTIKKDGAAFATTTSNTVYIRNTGTYTAEVKGSGEYAIELSNVVGTINNALTPSFPFEIYNVTTSSLFTEWSQTDGLVDLSGYTGTDILVLVPTEGLQQNTDWHVKWTFDFTDLSGAMLTTISTYGNRYTVNGDLLYGDLRNDSKGDMSIATTGTSTQLLAPYPQVTHTVLDTNLGNGVYRRTVEYIKEGDNFTFKMNGAEYTDANNPYTMQRTNGLINIRSGTYTGENLLYPNIRINSTNVELSSIKVDTYTGYYGEPSPPPSLTYDNYNKITLNQLNYEDTTEVTYYSNAYNLGTAKTMYVKDIGEYVFKISGTDKYVESNVHVSSVDLAGATTKPIDFDGYNKLTLIDAGSNVSANVTYFSNTYEIGSANVLYINGSGTYNLEMSGSNVFALSSNVTGTISSFDPSSEWTKVIQMGVKHNISADVYSNGVTGTKSNWFNGVGTYNTASDDNYVLTWDRTSIKKFLWRGRDGAWEILFSNDVLDNFTSYWSSDRHYLPVISGKGTVNLDVAGSVDVSTITHIEVFGYGHSSTVYPQVFFTNNGNHSGRVGNINWIEHGNTGWSNDNVWGTNHQGFEVLVSTSDTAGHIIDAVPPSLTFDTYNKLTLENFTTVSDKQWPPADGTLSSFTVTNSDKDAEWTISGASYGNGTYKAKYDKTIHASHHPGQVFDRIENSTSGEFHSASGADRLGNLSIEFPESFVVDSYEFRDMDNSESGSGTYAPKDFTMQGSHDGSTWVTLDTQSGINTWATVPTQKFTVTGNSTAYKHYRISVSDTNGGNYLEIMEMRFYQRNTRTAKLTDPNGDTYSLGQTQNDIYIKDQGDYFLEVTNSDQSAVVKTDVGAISTPPLGTNGYTFSDFQTEQRGETHDNVITFEKTDECTSTVGYWNTSDLHTHSGHTCIQWDSSVTYDAANNYGWSLVAGGCESGVTLTISSGQMKYHVPAPWNHYFDFDSGRIAIPSPSLTFDGYNKLSIENLTPTSSRLTYGSNTYEIGTASNVYIEHEGTYKMATGDATTFALVSKQVNTPAPKPDYTNIWAGEYSGMVIDSDGKLYTWGNDSNNQSGRGASDRTPTHISTISDPVSNVWVEGAPGRTRIVKTSTDKWYMWGMNLDKYKIFGQTGDQATPVDVTSYFTTYFGAQGTSDSTRIVKVVMSSSACSALAADGKVWSWGVDGNRNELGKNTTNGTTATPFKNTTDGTTELSNITDIRCLHYGKLALDSNGDVWQWGTLRTGSTGYPTKQTVSNSYVNISLDSGFYYPTNEYRVDPNTVQSPGYVIYTLYHLASSTFASSGHNIKVQLSNNTWLDANSGTHPDTVTDNGTTVSGTRSDSDKQHQNPLFVFTKPSNVITDSVNIIGIGSGFFTAYAWTTDGTIYSIGQGTEGQLGNGADSDQDSTWQTVTTLQGKTIYGIYGAGYSVFAHTSDGVYACGQGTNGRLGMGNNNNLNVFTKSTTLSALSIYKLDFGHGPGYVITTDGKGYALGYDYLNSIPTPLSGDKNVPTEASSLTNLSLVYQPPSLTYDTSNKLSIENLTPTSTTLTDPNGSSFDIGTASNVYIRDSGKYSIASKDANTFVLTSNTVTGTPTGTTYVYDSNTFTTPSQVYDNTKTITVSNIPSTQTGITGKIYKGATAYTIHATEPTSNVIIKNTGSYVSVFTTSNIAYFTNTVNVNVTPTTSDDNTIEDEALDVTTTTSVAATVAFHDGLFADSDDPHSDGSITAAATAGHIYSDTAPGTYTWGTLTSCVRTAMANNLYSDENYGYNNGSPPTAGFTTYKWTPPGAITNGRTLVVAGGGGGGTDMGGGGGAGGLLASTTTNIAHAEQTIQVGDGGARGYGPGNSNDHGGGDGANSSISGPGITSIGGGGGGTAHTDYGKEFGRDGGSGGGTSGYYQNGNHGPKGLGTSGQGNDGGLTTASYYSSGGGGAGEVGVSGANNVPGDGGNGLEDDILGTSYWWAGGGGANAYNSQGSGHGGKGGGGGGAATHTGHPTNWRLGLGDMFGITNGEDGENPGANWNTATGGSGGKHTGGGGGGGQHNTGGVTYMRGGRGGSGIVMIKFTVQKTVTIPGLAGSTAVPSETVVDTPSATLDATDTTVTDPTLNLDFTTTLPKTLKRYNGLSNSSIGARFNRRESRKKRIEKSISIPSSFSAELTANNASSPTTLTVTVANSKFVINGESKPTLGFIRGETYTFDQSDASNSGHPLVLVTSEDGATLYETGWTTTPSTDYTPGDGSAYSTFVVPYDVPDTIYYKCNVHPNMGGEINTTFGNAFSLGDFTVAANTHVSGEYTLAVNYNGTTSNLYVNGSLITQTTPTISAGTKDFILGKEFDGYVKNFKFWNYAKSFLVLLATGGTITYITGYVVHTFTSSGNFVMPSGRDVEYLVVAGGGGGGFGHAGGGGGAGGFVDGSVTVSTGTFPVVVGTGGAGSTAASVKGGYGTNSSFNGIIGLGGGGGGSRNTSNATDGGSGGGGSRVSGSAGSATQPSSSSSGYGNNGGTGAGGGSGGGGAGGVGENGGDEGTVSVGGVGKISTISGNSLYYAAGGGGGTGAGVSDYAASASGIGGRGGSLSASGSLLNGQVNTGSGGGGGGNNVDGGDGGSGIVIIRYIA